MIKAFIFDLDDTLYPEYDYVKSGFRVIADAMQKKYGIENAFDKLMRLFEAEIGNVYNRLLEQEKIPYRKEDIAELVEMYRKHKPQGLRYFDRTVETLLKLRQSGKKLGIITDGRVDAQQAKIDALKVADLVDNIIITDSLGGEAFRKPDPTSFEKMLRYLNVTPEEAVYVGDNPQKDFAIKKYMPINTVRIFTGNSIYNETEYKFGIRPDKIINNIGELLEDERFF